MTKVAIVTGANKGIGYAIVRGLCKQFDGDVYLTARDVSRGQEAISKLEGEGLKPRFHQLDIADEASIGRMAKYMKETYGGVDILVNNAGIAFKQASTAPVSEQAEVTMKINFWGTLAVCSEIFPILKPGSRVVHLSSTMSSIAFKQCSPEIKEQLNSCKTVEDVGRSMDQFVACAKSGEMGGWPSTCYGCTKIGVSLVTAIQQRTLDESKSDIVVNACCPGYVSTDMSSFKGPLTIDQGADTPIYLALLPPGTDIRGKYLTKREVVVWNK